MRICCLRRGLTWYIGIAVSGGHRLPVAERFKPMGVARYPSLAAPAAAADRAPARLVARVVGWAGAPQR